MNNAMKTWRILAVAALALCGVLASGYLTVLHVNFLRTGQPSVCNFNQAFNCDAVNTSAWSELFGVPLSHWATLFHVFVGALALVGARVEAARPRVQAYLALLAGTAVLASLYLLYVSLALIKALCLFCTVLYGIHLLMLALLGPGAAAALRDWPARLGDDLKALARPPVLGLAAALLLAGAVSSWQLRTTLQGLTPPGVAAQEQRVWLEGPGLPSLGPAGAPVTIVEVSDFECPYCQRATQTLEEAVAAYPNQIRVVFRNFPLDMACNPLMTKPLHDQACAAARAAVCAHKQNKFWPYAKKLFADGCENADLPAHAKELGLSLEAFTACLSAPESKQAVAADIAACQQAGIQAVPIFLINGRKLAGAQPLVEFRKLIDLALREQATPALPR